MGQNDLCEVVFTNNFKTPIQNTENCKTGYYKEPDYIEADNESHDNSNHGIFYVTEKDLELIDVNSIFDNDKMVI